MTHAAETTTAPRACQKKAGDLNRHLVFEHALGILCVSFSIFLVACAVGPDFVPPAVEVPAGYRLDTMPIDGATDLKWWELFEDPLVHTLVTAALENNRDLKIAASRIEQARAFLGFTRADQYPGLNLQGGATAGNFFGSERTNSTDSTLYIAAPLSWEIDFWGKYRRATAAARAELVATEYGLRTVQLSLVAEVIATYYLLLDFHQRLSISESTLQSRQKSLNLIQQRYDKGIISELDLNQAQIQMEIAAAAIPLYQRSISQTENALSILLGRLPEPIKTGIDLNRLPVPPAVPTGLPSTLLERRPDIIAAMNLLEAQTEKIGVAEALRLPAISLTGTLGIVSTELGGVTTQGGFWSLGAGLLGPIYEFGKNIRRVDIEKALTQQARYQYENTVLTAFRDVEDALVEIETYKRQITAVQNQLKAARNANMLSTERYNRGYSTYLEVLETERSLFNVQLQYSELKQQQLTAYVNLYKALGGGWISATETE
ncbi:MAG: efflux transporter outer membrane subunit [Desulfobacterales bacterium]